MIQGLQVLITVWSTMISFLPLGTSFVSPTTNTAVLRSPCTLQRTHNRIAMTRTDDDDDGTNNDTHHTDNFLPDRRRLFSNTITAASSSSLLFFLVSNPQTANADIEGVATPPPADLNPAQTESPENGGQILYTTKSGLRYIEQRKGTGRTPQYGNLCQISYKAYIKLPGETSELQQYDEDKSYLIKHGNGRVIPGLDEGLHTLAVGGKRRIIIPPKLGYIGPGVLGPLPETPWGRSKLDRLLNSMIEKRGGNVVVDVELRSVIPDEADQGYYKDDTIEPEDFETLRQNLSATAKAAREKGEVAVDFFEGI